MPFPDQEPRTFTRAAIESLDPGQIGVYGLFRAGVWVYIGGGDIRRRLLGHFNGDNTRIMAERPTHFVAAVTADDVAWEQQLILEHDPVANRDVGWGEEPVLSKRSVSRSK